MRFAIKTRPEHTTWAQIRDVWVAADEASLFESAWNWDHFYPLTGDFAGPNLEAWTMLAALAQATSRIRSHWVCSGRVLIAKRIVSSCRSRRPGRGYRGAPGGPCRWAAHGS